MSRLAIVLGAGASGLAAARLLVRGAWRVVVCDVRPPREPVAEELAALGVRCAVSGERLPGDGPADLVVVSPGIPAGHAWIKAARADGIEVISELELGFRHVDRPVLAVTGSNGKSTVVKLCADAMAATGRRVAAGANYGAPLSALAIEATAVDWFVLEVSSFQLEWVDTFRPRVGVLLNLLPNHLDRHGDMDTYAVAKLRLFRRMDAGDMAVVPLDWAARSRRATAGACAWRTFGSDGVDADFAYAAGRLRARRTGQDCPVDASFFDNPILGPHAAAAWAALDAVGLTAADMEQALATATPLPHRMRRVAEQDGVLYINDSKATNLASLCAAVQMCDSPVRLIAGGRLKEKNLEWPKELLANRVARVYVIGEASATVSAAWDDAVPCIECKTLASAVRAAQQDAAPGDVVLLSPGCASFDQFSGFADRGEQYEKLVKCIVEGGRT